MNTSHAQTQPATKPAHTPTPWTLEEGTTAETLRITGEPEAVPGCANDKFTPLVAMVHDGSDYPDRAKLVANGQLIVRAVNSHASLIEALEAAMEELEANKVAMIGPEWASQRTMTGGALAKCARALRNAKAQA